MNFVCDRRYLCLFILLSDFLNFCIKLLKLRNFFALDDIVIKLQFDIGVLAKQLILLTSKFLFIEMKLCNFGEFLVEEQFFDLLYLMILHMIFKYISYIIRDD